MTEEPAENTFLKHSKNVLDQSLENMDTLTSSRLAAARRRAVEAAESSRVHHRSFWYVAVPSGAAASILLAVVLLGPWSGNSQAPNVWEDLEILASDENLEMYENLEFYSWLAEQDDAS